MTERSWTNFAPRATVGIPPTAASWTNSPPPHSSIHWDDHITGMITSLGFSPSIPDLPRGEHMWFAVVLVAPEIAACPADRLRALHAVVIGLAVQADRASPAPGSRSRVPVRLACPRPIGTAGLLSVRLLEGLPPHQECTHEDGGTAIFISKEDGDAHRNLIERHRIAGRAREITSCRARGRTTVRHFLAKDGGL